MNKVHLTPPPPLIYMTIGDPEKERTLRGLDGEHLFLPPLASLLQMAHPATGHAWDF